MEPKLSPRNMEDLSKFRADDMFLHVEDEITKVKDRLDPYRDHKVLILYTGGTIGMVNSEQGYIAKKGYLHELMRKNKYFCDEQFTAAASNSEKFLITPITTYSKRIYYKVIEFDEIIDSTNMTAAYWIQIATAIKKHYKAFDGFIILHGTDTMAYTASALSFMFENLSKPVILTGAQIPLSEMRNDGFQNLLGSLTIAGHFMIPEVMIFFRDKLIRGNRASKVDNFGMEAFDSPKFPYLGNFGVTLEIDWKKIRNAPTYNSEELEVMTDIGKKIAVVKIYPLIEYTVLKGICQDADAIILEGYGLGNIPTNRPGLLKVLEESAAQGKLVVVITQCTKGTTNPIYAVGKEIVDKGIVNGYDMTLEAAIAKISYLLGKTTDVKLRKQMVQQDLRGELTSQERTKFDMRDHNFLQVLSEAINISSQKAALKVTVFPVLLCYAANSGFQATIQELKEVGADVKGADYEGRTPLHIAAAKGHLSIVEYLIENGANVNAKDFKNRTPLWESAVHFRKEISKVLLARGAKIEGPYQETTHHIMKCVLTNNIQGLRHLYYCGFKDFSIYTTIDGRNLAHLAASEGKVDVIEFLRDEVTFNFTIKDRWGKTPLDEARDANQTEIIEILGCLAPSDISGACSYKKFFDPDVPN